MRKMKRELEIEKTSEGQQIQYRNRNNESTSEVDMSREIKRVNREEEQEGSDHLSSFAGSLGLPRLLYCPFRLLCSLAENGAI